MKKFKTLKDVNKNWSVAKGIDNVCPTDELKQAAQEWINYINKFDRNGRTYADLKGFDREIDFHYYHRELLIDFLRMFFNLEDE